jgi:exonuclease VII small subunit
MMELEEAMKSYKNAHTILGLRDKEIVNMRLEVDKIRK